MVPAEYAFVLHTANPITRATGQVFGEAVVGMGEALVGNQPGRALSFSASRAGGAGEPQVELLSLPSKRCGLFSPAGASNLIARSDSNGEDLEAFAGAGTFTPVLRLVLEKAGLFSALLQLHCTKAASGRICCLIISMALSLSRRH